MIVNIINLYNLHDLKYVSFINTFLLLQKISQSKSVAHKFIQFVIQSNSYISLISGFTLSNYLEVFFFHSKYWAIFNKGFHFTENPITGISKKSATISEKFHYWNNRFQWHHQDFGIHSKLFYYLKTLMVIQWLLCIDRLN